MNTRLCDRCHLPPCGCDPLKENKIWGKLCRHCIETTKSEEADKESNELGVEAFSLYGEREDLHRKTIRLKAKLLAADQVVEAAYKVVSSMRREDDLVIPPERKLLEELEAAVSKYTREA